MRLRRRARLVPDDRIRYWPACPTCGGPVGCYGRGDGTWINNERTEPPTDVWAFRCNQHKHQFALTTEQLEAGQAKGPGFWL